MSRDLILIALALMTWGLGEGMFIFYQPLYLEQLGASPVLIGTIIGAIGVAMAASHLPAGYLADRFGRRPLLIAAWFMGAAATWIMALANSLPQFVLGAAFYAVTAFVISPLNSYVTAARGQLSVGRVLTLISATYSTGAVVGPILGGWIGNQVGLKLTFLVAAIIFIISTGIILFIRPQPVEHPISGRRSSDYQQLINLRILRYLIVVFVVMFSIYLPQPLSQNFLQNERGINLSQMGFVLSFRSIGVVVLNLLLGQVSAPIGFLLAQLLMGAFSLLLWQGSSIPAFTLGYFFLGSYQTARSLAIAQFRSLLQSGTMGLGYGLVETVNSSAIILAPPLAGLLYENNPVSIYIVSLGLIIFAILITLILSPLRKADQVL